MEKTLFIIPARGGSKGIIGKNIKILNNKPLIYYSIEFAKKFAKDEDICVSTDDETIAQIVTKFPLSLPFLRPQNLAKDHSPMEEVLNNALNFYLSKGICYDNFVLLQPTSPFRRTADLEKAFSIYKTNKEIDMVVSVTETKDNPYFNVYEEDTKGYLFKSKIGNFGTRQECPPVWRYNGSLYLVRVESFFKTKSLPLLEKKTKIEMPDLYSIDLDTPLDWEFAEFLIQKNLILI